MVEPAPLASAAAATGPIDVRFGPTGRRRGAGQRRRLDHPPARRRLRARRLHGRDAHADHPDPQRHLSGGHRDVHVPDRIEPGPDPRLAGRPGHRAPVRSRRRCRPATAASPRRRPSPTAPEARPSGSGRSPSSSPSPRSGGCAARRDPPTTRDQLWSPAPPSGSRSSSRFRAAGASPTESPVAVAPPPPVDTSPVRRAAVASGPLVVRPAFTATMSIDGAPAPPPPPPLPKVPTHGIVLDQEGPVPVARRVWRSASRRTTW